MSVVLKEIRRTKLYPNPKLGQLIDRGKKKKKRKEKKTETETKVKVKMINKLYTQYPIKGMSGKMTQYKYYLFSLSP